MEQFTWNESLSIGVPEIDAQHKRLFDLANIVAQAVLRNAGREVAAAALRSLCDYAVEHFAAEEALMDMDAYPEYDLHVTEHMNCTQKALEFLEYFSENQEVDMVGFLEFLVDWVHTHIMKVDQTLGRHLKARSASRA